MKDLDAVFWIANVFFVGFGVFMIFFFWMMFRPAREWICPVCNEWFSHEFRWVARRRYEHHAQQHVSELRRTLTQRPQDDAQDARWQQITGR